MEFDKCDLRKLVYYCWKRNLTTFEMVKEINSVLGNESVNQRSCQRYIKRFKEGNFNTDDEIRSGRPSLELNDQIQLIIDNDNHATTRSIAYELNQDKTTVWRKLIGMGKRFVDNGWVPHKLTEVNKQRRKEVCNELLRMHGANNFLRQCITMDECWIYWDNGGVFGNRSWRGAGDQPIPSVKRTLSKRKHMVSIFWDCKGLLLMEVLPMNTSINSQYYCEQLDKLKESLREKRRRLINSGAHNIHFLHDNASSHTANVSQQKLQQLGFTVLPHPPYSPDIAPSDYFLFSPLKSVLRNKNFNSSQEITDVLNQWFASKSVDFFQKAFDLLPQRWQKCIQADGDYFTHLNDVDDDE